MSFSIIICVCRVQFPGIATHDVACRGDRMAVRSVGAREMGRLRQRLFPGKKSATFGENSWEKMKNNIFRFNLFCFIQQVYLSVSPTSLDRRSFKFHRRQRRSRWEIDCSIRLSAAFIFVPFRQLDRGSLWNGSFNLTPGGEINRFWSHDDEMRQWE